MERVYAFTDEYGAFGWDIDNPTVTTLFIVTAIVVKESDLEELRKSVEEVRIKHFQTGEMKSSGVGANHNRRRRIVADILPLPFNIFSICVDKRELPVVDYPGLRHISSFYKFINNIVHKELRRAYKQLTIVADQSGTDTYMESFARYVAGCQDVRDLFGEADFLFEDSKSDIIIQLADLISGTLGHQYDPSKHAEDTPNYYKMLEKKIFRIEHYPKHFNSYILENSAIASEYDERIAKICFEQARTYINTHEDNEDVEVQARVATLKYLLFRFMNNDTRKYIPTWELRNLLENMEIGRISTHRFRSGIIAKLRDEGIIIASSKNGYKIPSRESELYDFINHGATVVLPMLGRLQKCREIIKMGTHNNLDLLAHDEYAALRKYFDN
ncbi:MAG: DUF3800 domain-containing protein [Oscillospiraceae bacterium]|nr:DUF3800 domain-containing protein [Oscillospiraceae bacterium]